jgi:hypothetical protein
MKDSPSWREPYLAALQESDKEKLTELVQATEAAMFLRFQQIETDPSNHNEERSEMKAACADLLSIQINTLGWPSSLPEMPSP